ncbi:MAG: Gfo/Idh/MocA family oxidoreductase, partial [Thermoguttaceae bacterium]|nr:Gfo/Idh/MocA family oxidoreductase [Thermoguttaceae bacterium]
MRSTRRDFLKSAASAALVAGVASPTLIPRSALADGTRPGANDRIGVAGIGVGRRGSEIFASAARNPKAQAICVADVWLPRAENIAKKHNCDAAYQDYRRVLDRKDVDAVLTATPEHWRGLVCINACLAGKHVYGEKPITLTISEGALMEKAARKNNVVFQTGSQQRSQRQNYVGCEFIRNGGLGQIKEVIAANYESPWLCDLPAQPIPDGLDWETWCGPTPVVPYNIDLFTPRAKPGWLSFRPYSGGEMTGWGTHGFDQIQCALGTDLTMPTEIIVEEGAEKLIPPVYSQAEDAKRGNELCSKPRLAYTYANGVIVRLGNANRGGGIFIGEKGKMEIFRGNLMSNPPEIAEELLKSERRDQDHVDNWLSCILTGER